MENILKGLDLVRQAEEGFDIKININVENDNIKEG